MESGILGDGALWRFPGLFWLVERWAAVDRFGRIDRIACRLLSAVVELLVREEVREVRPALR